jgi:hypothetical protein
MTIVLIESSLGGAACELARLGEERALRCHEYPAWLQGGVAVFWLETWSGAG